MTIEKKSILVLDTECCDLKGHVYDVGYTVTIHYQRDSSMTNQHILLYPQPNRYINNGVSNEPLVLIRNIASTQCKFHGDDLWICTSESFDGSLRTNVISTDQAEPIKDGLHIRHEMQNAAVPSNFGVGIAFDLEDTSSTTEVKNQGAISVSLAGSSPDGQNSAMIFKTRTTRNNEISSQLTESMTLTSTTVNVRCM